MASITITTTAPQDARIAPAFGELLRLGRDATVGEVKSELISLIRGIVISYEKNTLSTIYVPPPLDPT